MTKTESAKEVTDIILDDLSSTSATFNVWYGDNQFASVITIDVPHALFDDMLADAWVRIEASL